MKKEEVIMQFQALTISGRVAAILAIIFGIIILVVPQIIAYLIGIFLIIIGILHFVKK